MAQYIAKPRRAQTLIMFTLMITLLIGFIGLVVDLGFSYGGRRFAQNAADAGAVAGARLLAGSIIKTSDGGYAFTATTADVQKVVDKYAEENKGLQPVGANYPAPTVEYLDVNKNVLTPVAGAVPLQTAMVRVTRPMDFETLFAPVINVDNMAVSARATAKISPVERPKYPPGPTWPMTRYDDPTAVPDPPAPGTCPDPVLFWSGNPAGDTGTTANWKQLMYMGRMSARVNRNDPDILTNHEQLITEFANPSPPQNDPYSTTPPADLSGADVQVALEYWFRNGFKGKLTAGDYVLPPTTKNGNHEPGSWIKGTHGDKLETIGGNLGSNMSTAMQDYISNNIVGTDGCGGDFTIVYMYLWREDTAERWRKTPTPSYFEKTTGSQIDRVTLTRWEPFKFYLGDFSFPNSSEIYGYWTSMEIGALEPLPGPPSQEANTVHLVE